LTPEEVTKRL